MFGTIRKHQTWLWVFIITITIIGMIGFFSPTSQFSGRQSSSVNYGVIDGVPVTEEEYDSAVREAFIGFFLTHGGDTRAQFDEPAETLQRIYLIRRLKEYNVDVDSDSVVRDASIILQETGLTLDRLVQMLSRQVHIRDTDFQRYVRHNLAIRQMGTLIGISGDLVTPRDAEKQYAYLHEEIVTGAVFFSGTNYMAGVTSPSPEALARFYTNRSGFYRIPDRVQVGYVKFDRTNFLADADQQMAAITNLTLLIEREYQQRGAAAFRDAKSPEEAKQKIRDQIRREISLTSARKKANEFASALFDLGPLQLQTLAAFARSNGLAFKISAPFDEMAGPADFDGGPNFARVAFMLTTNEPIAGQVILSEDAVFVMGLDKKIPSEEPSLNSIHDKILADYRVDQAITLAQRTGAQFAQTVSNGLAQGKTFAAVCAEAKVKPVAVPPFSRVTQSLPIVDEHASLGMFKEAAFSTPVGKVSGFNPDQDGGFVVQVDKLLPVDAAKMKAELPEFTQQERLQRRQVIFSTWRMRGWNTILRDNPGLQQRRQSQPGRS